MRSFLSIILLCFFSFSYCQNVIISGNNPEYSGDQIFFFKYNDPINKKEEKLFSFLVNQDGSFSCTFPAVETIYSFVHLGVFKASIFFEPGHSYEIILPPKVNKTEAEKLNPYFDEIEIDLGIKTNNKNELNFLIQELDVLLNNFIDLNIYKIRQGVFNKKIDTLFFNLNDKFSDIQHKYFNNYKKYRFAYIKFLANSRSAQTIVKHYYSNKEILYRNKAYMDLFNLLFERFLYNYSKEDSGKCLSGSINMNRGLADVLQCIGNDVNLSGNEFRELVLIKGIHDSFYKNDFSKTSLLFLAESLTKDATGKRSKEYSNNLKTKLLQMYPGQKAPDFSLNDLSGKINNLKDFSGHFIYLNFFNSVNYACQKDFILLNDMHKKYSDILNIVSISVDNNIDSLQSFINKNNYQWTILHFSNQQSIIDTYNVKAYPSYFLIDPEGKVLLSPAPLPSESFEDYLLGIRREKHIKELRSGKKDR